MIFRSLTQSILLLAAAVRELRLELKGLRDDLQMSEEDEAALRKMNNDLDSAGNSLKQAVSENTN